MVRIYTANGGVVRELRDNAGLGQLEWDVKDDTGEIVATGVYLYEVRNGSNYAQGKLLVVR